MTALPGARGAAAWLDGLVAERERVLTGFLGTEQERLALACHDLARAFARGGTLLAYGSGAAATDAAHVAVEFMHPVIVGKRALPALAGADPALIRPDDVVLGLVHGGRDPLVEERLAAGRRLGALTIALGGDGSALDADHAFAVPSSDRDVVQEVHETTYHVLWELVHVFFEHPGLLEEHCVTCGDIAVQARVVAVGEGTALVEHAGAREEVAVDLVGDPAVGDVLLCHAGVAIERAPADDPTAFLYPFLESEETGLDAVLADVRASTVRKGADTVALRGGIDAQALARCAHAVRTRLQGGGRLIAFGNGGSSTDAQDVVIDCLARAWPAIALNDDVATITAVGNDVGFENVFSRQLIALGRAGDVALGISTSGSSANVVAGLEEAHRRGMLTCALAGYDGGRLAEMPWLDHLLVARSDYIPRLQEAHATMYHLLLGAIGDRR